MIWLVVVALEKAVTKALHPKVTLEDSLLSGDDHFLTKLFTAARQDSGTSAVSQCRRNRNPRELLKGQLRKTLALP